MNFGNYTQKSLEAIRNAQQIAVENTNQQLEQCHILLALLRQEGGLIPQLLQKMEKSVDSLDAAVNALVQRLPRVTGSREADRFYISSDADAALQSAQVQADAMKDSYVSVEHLFLGLLDAGAGEIKKLFATYRITKENAL